MPLPLRVLRVAFGSFLVLALAFSLLMAAWGDLRDAIFVQLLDARYAKSFVIRAPQGAKVWLGYRYLGAAERPPVSDGEPDLVIDGVPVTEARVYADEAVFMKEAVICERGSKLPALLAKLAPGRELVHAGAETVSGPGVFIRLLLRENGELDAACLCTLEIPQAGGDPRLFAFLLRVQAEDLRCIDAGTFSIASMQLYARDGEFWTTREDVEGFPTEGPRGQSRTSWRMLPTLMDKDAQAAYLRGDGFADPKWIELSERTK